MNEPVFLTSTNAASCSLCMGCGTCGGCAYCGTCGISPALVIGLGVTVTAAGYVSAQWWG